MQSRQELKRYKTEIISKLAEVLHTYLHSSLGREDILNPPDTRGISDVMVASLLEEVHSRLKNGVQRHCERREVQSFIEDADTRLRSLVKDIEQQLQDLEIEISEIYAITNGIATLGLGFGLGLLFLPSQKVFTSNCRFVHTNFHLTWFWQLGHECRSQWANKIYDDCLSIMRSD